MMEHESEAAAAVCMDGEAVGQARPRRYRATFQFTTPAFASSDGGTAELRPTAIKGMIRFWWRFAAWPRFSRIHSDNTKAISAMKQEEDLLFGTAASLEKSERGAGQAILRLRLHMDDPTVHSTGECLKGADGRTVAPGARYLGYGVLVAFGERAGQLERDCIADGTEFHLDITVRPQSRATDDQIEGVIKAVRLFGLLGGVGARSRRGWGSVHLLSLTGPDGETSLHSPPSSANEYLGLVRQLIGPCDARRPPYTAAFRDDGGRGLRVDLLRPTDMLKRLIGRSEVSCGLQVLECLGTAMVLYRGWGSRGEVQVRDTAQRRVQAHRRFDLDHDWFKGGPAWNGRSDAEKDKFHPKRAVFGLPQNYDKGSSVAPLSYDRRASPLLLHVARICGKKGGYVLGVALTVPANFLPPDKNNLNLCRQKVKAKVPAKVDYGLLAECLNVHHDGELLLKTVASWDGGE